MGWRDKAKRAKQLHRPSLKNWECDGLYETFPGYVEKVLGTDDSASVSATSSVIPVLLDSKSLSPPEFWQQYEGERIPCVIRNLPTCSPIAGRIGDIKPSPADDHSRSRSKRSRDNDDAMTATDGCACEFQVWPALRRWDPENMKSDPSIRNRLFKVGEDDGGKSIKMKMKHFLRYMQENRDDSPLYVFDSAFDEDKRAKNLLDDYTVPVYFEEDLFHLVGERRRPPYRWFLVGPKRSGTTVHIDPLGTSAWNTLVFGKKQWVLFPPHVPKRIVKGKGLVWKDEDDEAIHYFMNILPRIKNRAEASGGAGDHEGFACHEFVQHAGETVFIPHGWWHAVLNLTDTVGITQNYCSSRNFDEAWVKTRIGRKKMAYKWLCQLDIHYPHLAHRARTLNERDDFIMKYDPDNIRKREWEEERRKRDKGEAKETGREKKRRKKRDTQELWNGKRAM